MVLLEAQACGKAVIAGASGGTAETMQISKTGQVVDCNQPDELGKLVSEWLTHRPLLGRMGKLAHEWVVSRFEWSVLSREAEELFRSRSEPNAAHSGLVAASP